MYDEAEKQRAKIQNGKILNLPLLRLNSIRRNVFREVLLEIAESRNENRKAGGLGGFRTQQGSEPSGLEAERRGPRNVTLPGCGLGNAEFTRNRLLVCLMAHASSASLLILLCAIFILRRTQQGTFYSGPNTPTRGWYGTCCMPR
jgi:hypothetical protein